MLRSEVSQSREHYGQQRLDICFLRAMIGRNEQIRTLASINIEC